MEYYTHFTDLKKENHIFTFTGPLCFEEVVLFRELIEKILNIQTADNRQKKRVVSILVEALQNIQKYGQEDKNQQHQREGKDCLVMLAREESSYILVFGNFINNVSKSTVENKLVKIISLELPALKELYLQILDQCEITPSGGASLGLIKMFLDSEMNSDYSFHEIDEEYSFFTLKLKVS
jgi:hypothetical protein